MLESWDSFQAFRTLLHTRKKARKARNIFQTFRLGILRNPENLEGPESWELFLVFSACFYVTKSHENEEYLCLVFHAFPGYWGWYSMLSKENANPGKCGKPTDSALSWVFFMYKKPEKREFFPWNSADVLAVFARVSEAFIST